MKFHVKLQAGSKCSEHQVELLPLAGGPAAREGRRFELDGEVIELLGEEVSPGFYSILRDGRSFEAHVSKRPGDAAGLQSPYVVTVGLRHYLVEIHDPRRWRRGESAIEAEGPQEILAPMPGKIVKVLVAESQRVERNQGLLIIEAMKMQNELRAPRSSRVERIYVEEGMGVEAGFRLLRLL
jgi:biotin carboxyl carrier protein